MTAPGRDDGRAHRIALGVDLDPALTGRLLGLTGPRIDLAALVDRDRQRADDAGGGAVVAEMGHVIALLQDAAHADHRIEIGLGDLDLKLGGIDAMQRGDDGRVRRSARG
jgi:hypothetical protein